MSKYRVYLAKAAYAFQQGAWLQYADIRTETILISRAVKAELGRKGVEVYDYTEDAEGGMTGNDLIVQMEFNASDNRRDFGARIATSGFTELAHADLLQRFQDIFQGFGFQLIRFDIEKTDCRAKRLVLRVCTISRREEMQAYWSRRDEIANQIATVIAKGRVSNQ